MAWPRHSLKTPQCRRRRSLAAALGPAGLGPAWSSPVPALQLTARMNGVTDAVRDLLRDSTGAVSPLRTALAGRVSRTPLEVARVLAPKYPVQPIMSYIPALSWAGALRLARMTGETGHRAKADRGDGAVSHW